MIGINGPNFIWADQGFIGSAFTQELDTDLVYRYGAIPMLWRLRGKNGAGNIDMIHTWRRCKERGIRQMVVECIVPHGPLPEQASWWVDQFGGDFDALLKEGLYPIVEPWGEGDLDHPQTPYAKQAERWWQVREAIQSRWGLLVIPSPWAQDRERTPRCVQAYDEIYRETGLISWHFYAVTPADMAAGADFSPQWITAKYPAAQVFILEWGMLYDKNNPDSRNWTNEERAGWILSEGRRMIANPQVAVALHFLPYGTEDWRQHFIDSEPEREAMRVVCNEARAARIWPRYTAKPSEPVVIPPAVPADNLEHVRVIRNLALRQRQQVQELLFHLGKLDSDAQEIIDRCRAAGVAD